MMNRVSLFKYSAKYAIFMGLSWVPDEIFLKIFYIFKFRKRLNLENPMTYNEKIQWLKLYDRREEYTSLVDKYEAKIHASRVIGNQYIIPTLGIWDNVKDIEFDALPDRFVLKCTHDSGSVVICKNKREMDKEKVVNYLQFFLSKSHFITGREWPYKEVRPRIIAEEYMEDEDDGELRDYKFFCFDGVPKYMFIATNRQGNNETCFDFYDMEGQHLDILNGHPNYSVIPHLPKSFEKMKELATILSKGFPHIRIDFYDVDGKPYFGEFTLYHWSGFRRFDPPQWDNILGNFIKLPGR